MVPYQLYQQQYHRLQHLVIHTNTGTISPVSIATWRVTTHCQVDNFNRTISTGSTATSMLTTLRQPHQNWYHNNCINSNITGFDSLSTVQTPVLYQLYQQQHHGLQNLINHTNTGAISTVSTATSQVTTHCQPHKHQCHITCINSNIQHLVNRTNTAPVSYRLHQQEHFKQITNSNIADDISLTDHHHRCN